MDRLLYPIPEAGHLLGIGRTRAYELVNTGELESVRIGGRRLVPREAVETFVARARAEAAA